MPLSLIRPPNCEVTNITFQCLWSSQESYLIPCYLHLCYIPVEYKYCHMLENKSFNSYPWNGSHTHTTCLILSGGPPHFSHLMEELYILTLQTLSDRNWKLSYQNLLISEMQLRKLGKSQDLHFLPKILDRCIIFFWIQIVKQPSYNLSFFSP